MRRILVSIVMSGLLGLTGCSGLTQAPTQTMLIGSANAAAIQSAHGLSLSLSLDSTTYHTGQEISMVVDEENTLSSTNHVRSSHNWMLNGLILNECGIEYYPFGVAIFQGYYTSLNVSKATSLYFYNPYAIEHGCPEVSNGQSYDFASLSDNIISISNDNTYSYNQLKYELVANGYWTKDSTDDYNSSFSNFNPGVYTVVAGDEWGALVVVHFTVSQ